MYSGMPIGIIGADTGKWPVISRAVCWSSVLTEWHQAVNEVTDPSEQCTDTVQTSEQRDVLYSNEV